jgi:hypothetical protein
MPNSSRPKEKIDERVLRLIGLEDVFDLDYDTYRLNLKEVLVKISLGKLRIPDEERDLLVAELKRIRGSNKKGRFQVNAKKTKITSASLGVKKTSEKISQKMLSGTKFIALPQSIPEKKQKAGLAGSLEKDVAAIRASVDAIYETLALQQSLLSNQYEKDRKAQENARRGAREGELEKKTSLLGKVAEKLLAPVKSILSRIIDFFVKMILGRALMKLIDWISDPQNRSKVSSVFKFLKTFWPALLAAYILFGTKLGSFAGSLIASVGGFLLKLTKFAIPGLLRFIARHPVGAAAVALGTFGLWGPEVIPGLKSKNDKEDPEGGYAFKGGGGTDGLVRGKRGVDQINARLSDGEFVMSPGAVKMWGVDTLARMNSAGGGTNKPKIYGGKTYAIGGGPFNIPSFRPENSEMSPIGTLDRLREYIKSSTGYDASKPGTWAKSFGTGIGGMFGGKGGSSRSSGGGSSLDPLINQGQGLANQGLGLLSAAADPRSYQGLLPKGSGGLLEQGQKFVNDLFKSKKPTQQPSGSGGNPILAGLGKFIGGIADNPYFGETSAIEREKRLGLMKPGADPLTKETKERLAKSDQWIKSLYDPTKDKGFGGKLKQKFQDIQDKGFFKDPLAFLKTEKSENFIESATGGRVKNFGASLQGVQMSLKALAGPLGKMFRVEDQGAMGRYLRPAMMEAQARGHGAVGAKALGQDLYNQLLPNKMANFALGQTSFMVDKSGRAKTGVTGTSADETWDFNKTAEKNFGDSRKGLKALANILQGKEASIGEGKNAQRLTGPKGALKALYEAGFKGMSGVYRMLQNTSYGNLRPMGSNIDLGGGFKPTDSRGRVLSSQQVKQAQQAGTKASMQEYMGPGYGPNDSRRKNTGQSHQSRFARPQNSGPGSVKPPTKPPVTVVKPSSSSGQGGGRGAAAAARRTNNRNRTTANHPSNGGSKKIFGIF